MPSEADNSLPEEQTTPSNAGTSPTQEQTMPRNDESRLTHNESQLGKNVATVGSVILAAVLAMIGWVGKRNVENSASLASQIGRVESLEGADLALWKSIRERTGLRYTKDEARTAHNRLEDRIRELSAELSKLQARLSKSEESVAGQGKLFDTKLVNLRQVDSCIEQKIASLHKDSMRFRDTAYGPQTFRNEEPPKTDK